MVLPTIQLPLTVMQLYSMLRGEGFKGKKIAAYLGWNWLEWVWRSYIVVTKSRFWPFVGEQSFCK